MKNETWKPVIGFEGRYEVSDLGRVRSLDSSHPNPRNKSLLCKRKGRVLKQRLSAGYFGVSLGQGVTRITHRLVLEAFVGPCPERMEACHNNGNRTDNRASNLRWDTRKNNHADKIEHGTSQRGENHGSAKFTAVDVERVRALRRAGCSQTEIAKWLGMSQSNVSYIDRGEAWKHL